MTTNAKQDAETVSREECPHCEGGVIETYPEGFPTIEACGHCQGTRVAHTVDRNEATVAALLEALKPFARFAAMFDAKPVGSLAGKPLPDTHAIYGIHSGTEWEAEITVGDLRRARQALAGEGA